MSSWSYSHLWVLVQHEYNRTTRNIFGRLECQHEYCREASLVEPINGLPIRLRLKEQRKGIRRLTVRYKVLRRLTISHDKSPSWHAVLIV